MFWFRQAMKHCWNDVPYSCFGNRPSCFANARSLVWIRRWLIRHSSSLLLDASSLRSFFWRRSCFRRASSHTPWTVSATSYADHRRFFSFRRWPVTAPISACGYLLGAGPSARIAVHSPDCPWLFVVAFLDPLLTVLAPISLCFIFWFSSCILNICHACRCIWPSELTAPTSSHSIHPLF